MRRDLAVDYFSLPRRIQKWNYTYNSIFLRDSFSDLWETVSLTFIELKAKALFKDLAFSLNSFALWLSPNHKFWSTSGGSGNGLSDTLSPQHPLSARLSSLRHRMLQLQFHFPLEHGHCQPQHVWDVSLGQITPRAQLPNSLQDMYGPKKILQFFGRTIQVLQRVWKLCTRRDLAVDYFFLPRRIPNLPVMFWCIVQTRCPSFLWNPSNNTKK